MKLDLLDASRATWGVVGQAMTRIRSTGLYSLRSLRDHGGVPANQNGDDLSVMAICVAITLQKGRKSHLFKQNLPSGYLT